MAAKVTRKCQRKHFLTTFAGWKTFWARLIWTIWIAGSLYLLAYFLRVSPKTFSEVNFSVKSLYAVYARPSSLDLDRGVSLAISRLGHFCWIRATQRFPWWWCGRAFGRSIGDLEPPGTLHRINEIGNGGSFADQKYKRKNMGVS